MVDWGWLEPSEGQLEQPYGALKHLYDWLAMVGTIRESIGTLGWKLKQLVVVWDWLEPSESRLEH